MKQSTNSAHVINVQLSDIDKVPVNVKYQDEELVIIDDLRYIPDFAARKIAFNVGVMCLTGKLQFEIGGASITLASGQAVFSQSHVIITNIMASPDIKCRMVCLSDRVLKNILQAQFTIWNKAMYPSHYYILNLSDTHISLFDKLLPAFSEKGGALSHEILICLLRASFLLVCDLLSINESEDAGINEASRMNTLFRMFLNNIAQRHHKKIKVSEYAAQLCITPKYLSTICRKVSGKSPSAWISEYVVEDIVYYLKNTDLSVKEIAHCLGFDNASFFGKFVHAHIGMSPNEYRRQFLSSTTHD